MRILYVDSLPDNLVDPLGLGVSERASTALMILGTSDFETLFRSFLVEGRHSIL